MSCLQQHLDQLLLLVMHTHSALLACLTVAAAAHRCRTGRERHKPVARGAAADTVGEAARPITDFTSLTAEDVERLQGLYNQARGDALAERDNEPAEPLPEDDDVLGGGMSEWRLGLRRVWWFTGVVWRRS